VRVILLHNPSAGDDRPTKTTLLAVLAAAGYAAEYLSTKHDGWEGALGEPADLVVVAGGDGTVAKVARSIAGCGSPLAILPLGTANNIARTFGLDGQPRDLVARWRNAGVRPLDLGVAVGPWGRRYFVEACGGGLFADFLVASQRPEMQKRLRQGGAEEQVRRGVESILSTLADYQPHHWRIVVDGRDLSGEYLMVEAMNIRSIGPRLELASAADPGDGLLDVALLPAAEREAFADYLRRRLAGEAARPRLTIERGRRIQICQLSCADSGVHVDDDLAPRAAGHSAAPESAARHRATVELSVEAGALEVLA
jgi:diacylglycerol kinase (ATP)